MGRKQLKLQALDKTTIALFLMSIKLLQIVHDVKMNHESRIMINIRYGYSAKKQIRSFGFFKIGLLIISIQIQ